MGNDRWLHHMSQIEPLFFFLLATTFSVAVLLGGGGVEAAMFAANHSRGHEAGGEVSAWRDCLESEERPVFACAIRFHERRGARTSSEMCILLRSVPSCRPRGPCHLEGGGGRTNEALARLWPGPRVSRQEQAEVTARPWWVQAEGMSGHGLNEVGLRQGASRRGAHSSFHLPLRNQPPSKKNDHGGISTFFLHPFFCSPSLAFFHPRKRYLGASCWCGTIVLQGHLRFEVGSIG